MQQIADGSGVTKAAMYYHFQSKEDLFAEVVRHYVNRFWDGIIALANSGGPLRATLESIAGFVIASGESVSLSLIEDMDRHLAPEDQKRIFTEHPTPEVALRRLFRRAIEAGEMRPLDVDVVTNLFVGMLMSVISGGSGAMHGESLRLPQPEDHALLVDVLLHGIAASDAPPAADPRS